MPVKAHVKGKRKAPPPPTITTTTTTTTTTTATTKLDSSTSPVPLQTAVTKLQPDERRSLNTSPSPYLSRSAVDHKLNKKKPAPTPPFPVIDTDTSIKPNLNIDENNLSSTSSKFPVKNYENKTIFNLNEFNNDTRFIEHKSSDTREWLKGEPVLLKYKIENAFDDNIDIKNDINGVAHVGNGNTEIWHCQYCTLENPFWKIVCAACDRIRPYGLSTKTKPSDSVSMRPEDLNITNNQGGEVKLRRTKNDLEKNDLSKTNRKSLNLDAQTPTDDVVKPKGGKNDEETANKRKSLAISNERDFTMNTLEMEKQRLRAVIRSMNNQALADKYPMQKEIKINNTDAESRKPKTHTYEKINDLDQEKIKNNFEKNNRNAKLDVKTKPNKISTSIQTNDVMARGASPLSASQKPQLLELPKNRPARSVSPKPGCSKDMFLTKEENAGKIQNDKKKMPDAYYDFIGNLAMYCDQSPLSGTMKKLEVAIENGKIDKTAIVTMNVANIDIPGDIDDPNSFCVNVYIDFNNAVEVKVRPNNLLFDLRRKILKEFVAGKTIKIYFNGLLIRRDDLTLEEYGMKDGSCIYVNTENVIVGVENAIKNVQPKVTNQPPKVMNQSNVPKISNFDLRNLNKQKDPQKENCKKVNVEKIANPPQAPRDQYRIEHIQLNRILIEKVNADQVNPAKLKYRGVYNYNPRFNPEALIEIENQKLSNSKLKHNTQTGLANTKTASATTKPDNMKKDHYLELLTLDNSNNIALNSEPFECPVCIVTYEPYEGIVLRNCLHIFCRDCVKQTIIHSDEAEVKCPFMDDTYTCETLLQDREIKALLTKEEHDEHLAKSLRMAENKIENSYHCRTINCKGWCIYEDNVNQFKCPICNLVNCLTCRVIHDGLDCKQYQDTVKNNIEGNPENAITKNMLEEMIEKGDAMNCPTCRVVLMKKWGCDWLKCSMCKTEICWVTRGPRWGSEGKGDTSGGCKCGVNGIKCHPKCNYCH